MKNLALALSLIFATTLCAQEVRSFKQHNMGRWGIPAGNRFFRLKDYIKVLVVKT